VNFSAISADSFLGTVLRYPLRWIPKDLVVPILQGPLRGEKWIIGSSTHGCWLGSYECEKQHRFAETVKPGAVVYDIGAHVGFYTLLASELVGPKGRVFAFEPVPRNLGYLHRHIRLNNCSNVVIIEAAVSDEAGKVRFDEGPSSSMGFVSKHASLEVKSVALDELYTSRMIPKADFIKMDIEGGEYRALMGAKRLLAEAHPVLFLATHSAEVHQQCCELVQGLSYRLNSLTGEDVQDTDELLCVA
jgi:FkbM family methyltransferase